MKRRFTDKQSGQLKFSASTGVRQARKSISNSSDWDETSHYYYDGQKSIETRNGCDQTIKQQVWG